MGNKFRLTRESSEDIGFVKSCLIIGAIEKNEFREWIDLVIKDSDIDELPLYIFDLINFDGSFYELLNIIGFTPDPILSDEEDNALYGIAIKRFGDSFDIPITKSKALISLEHNPQILDRFRKVFPFVLLNF
ncbi:hypothetical protein [Rodentibacter trehalosifermentans]|uniref:Uncharacterized protein n=1 Tax=Rodentibacter trehalosifermentans TaxID=1908263 RepID=A0A1V3IQK3_9PAST|nr:hypothetical protein [Rodentibacter trehalosifermentans]OOF44463.1 hypothetical protein BKK52_13085 [Rodentibacter trehalosifermentans]OOF52598.1 hypothetical protein BKK53_04605 [Rodentibacter trehalosifermentans]